MLGLLLITTALYGAAFDALGLFDKKDVQDDIDTTDVEDDLSLLDESRIDTLEEAFLDDPVLAQGDDVAEEDLLIPYEDTDWSSNEGTDGDDFIAFPDDLAAGEGDPIFGNGGDDVLLGSETEDAQDVLFGDEGDDTIFGRAGFDQIFGGEGDDTISGGDGNDLIVAGAGSDVVYGGAGDDNIFDSGYTVDLDGNDVIVAGDGDDGVIIEDGINLVSLGEGADHLMVSGETGDSVSTVVTDFDPEEDALLLGVYSEDYDMPSGVNGVALEYNLIEVETTLGTGTLVQPTIDDETAEALGDTTTAYAFLLGVTPEELENTDIQVILSSDESTASSADSIESVAIEMGATRI